MKTEHTLLEVLFPKVRAELLRVLFAAPVKHRYARELRKMTGLALSTVQDELRKLTAVKLLVVWSNGYHRFYRANSRHPLFAEIFRIVQISERLPRTKRSALHRQPRVQKKHRVRAASTLSPNRPTNWRLFSRTRKNSTA